MAAVVRQVDHVVVRTDDAASLFQLFTETLVLPVGWPLESYGAFQSGGVGFGNVIMELMRVGEGKGVGARSAFFAGIALEPVPLAEALAELDARGVAYGETQPPHGRQPWTEAMLTDLSRGCYVFLCEYTFGVDKRRQRIRRELDSRDGGPLGILRLDHIEVGVAHHDNASRNWQSVLAPALEPAPATWVLGDGPAITLSPAERWHLVLDLRRRLPCQGACIPAEGGHARRVDCHRRYDRAERGPRPRSADRRSVGNPSLGANQRRSRVLAPS